MDTWKVRSNQGVVERRESLRERRARNQRLGVIALVAALVVVVDGQPDRGRVQASIRQPAPVSSRASESTFAEVRDVGAPGAGTIAPDIHLSGATSGAGARTDRFRLGYGEFG